MEEKAAEVGAHQISTGTALPELKANIVALVDEMESRNWSQSKIVDHGFAFWTAVVIVLAGWLRRKVRHETSFD